MAKLEVLQCASCGSPLSPGALKCEYCGAQNLIKAKQNALKITSEVAKKYIAFYSEKTKENPKDTNALYSMGLLYLGLKNYELAQRNFKDAIDQSPLDPDVYYYYALALMGGKSISKLAAKDAERIEQYLGTAMGMETKCKYLALLAVLKERYYEANGLIVPGKSVTQTWNEAAEYTPEDLEELKDNLTLANSETAETLEKLASGTYEQQTLETGSEDDEGDYRVKPGEWTEEQIEEARKLDKYTRYKYYKHWWSPNGLPSIVEAGVIVKRMLWLLVALAISGVLSGIFLASCSDSFTDEATIYASSVNVVWTTKVAQQEASNKKANKKPLTAKEKMALRAEIVKDSTEKAKWFKSYYEDKPFLLDINYIENGTKKTYTYVSLSVWGVICSLIILLPLISWGRKTWEELELLDTLRTRKYLKARWQEYFSIPVPETRRKALGIFFSNFMSKVTDIELKRHRKSEVDFKGLTLFIGYGREQKTSDTNVAYPMVTYSIITLEDDCISFIQNTWHVIDDTVRDESSLRHLSYGDISTVVFEGGKLTIWFGDSKWELGCGKATFGMLFAYQNDLADPIYNTYSTTRTSDLQKFAAALRKLVQDYKNQRSK